MKLKQLVVGALAILLFCVALPAQTVSTSQVSGVVTDQTGAVIGGAQVQMMRTDTNLTRTTVTDANGYYVIPDLSVGPYRLQVSKEGFTTYVQNGIVLQVSSNPVLNATLNVGAQTQQVVVEASASMVETQSNGIGQVVDQQRVVELPLNGRQLTQLISLAGNTTPAPSGDLNSNKNYPTITISVTGGLPNGVTFLLDGGTHNDPFNNLNLPMPFPDAVQEFKVETSALPAQYGDHASAAVNAVTKSGTNSLHGDAFEFVRNYLFNAREADAALRDSLKRNQFGGVIGGPIKKDRLFFFVGFQDTIVKSNPSNGSATVPTTAMLNGDFSAFAAKPCQSSAVTLKAPFVNNVDPNWATDKDAAALKIVSQYLPVPTDQQCGIISFPVGNNSGEQLGVGRIDYQVSQKQTVFGRYLFGNYTLPVTWDNKNVLELNHVGQFNRAQSVALGDVYTFSPSVINSAHITVNRSLNNRAVVPYFDPNSLGINDFSLIKGFMGLSVSGGFSLGGGATNPGYFNSTTWQFSDDLDFIRGAHQFSFGVDYIYALMMTVNNRPTNGQFGFNSGGAGATGLGMADFLTGNLDSLLQGNPDFENDADNYVALYAQDSWKASRHLTLNYGVRWEPWFPYSNVNAHTEYFSPYNFINGLKSSVYVNAPAGLIFPGDPGFTSGTSYTQARVANFEPRVGVVWDPKGDGKMTVRAGYGVFYDTPQLFFDTRYSNSPPWGASISLTGPLGPKSFDDPWATYPGGDPFPALNAVSKSMTFPQEGVYVNTPQNQKPMYLQQWNFSIQKQIGAWLLSGMYLGNRTNHLPTATEADPAVYIPGACSAGQYGLTKAGNCSQTSNTNFRRALYLQNPAQGVFYSTIGQLDDGGVANYNGMELSAQHRLTQNFSVLANWTWSHCLSEASTLELTGPTYVIPGNRAASYSNCDSDRRQVMNVSFIANTPKFSNHLVNAIGGGWQFSTIIVKSTGGWSTVTTGADNAFSGIGGQIATQLSPNFYAPNKGAYDSTNSCSSTSCRFRVDYVNKSAFGAPPAGIYSAMRPLNVQNPGSLEVDTSLVRSFKITERQTAQFRWEVFNLPNIVNLGAPSTSLTSSTYGFITSAGSPRIMQFALKYVF